MRAPPPIFLARRNYRLRRATDAARFLPALGAFLVLLPLLWTEASTRTGVIYLFVVWAVLFVIAGILSRWLREDPGSPHDDTGDGDG